jgi:hypothetical protein
VYKQSDYPILGSTKIEVNHMYTLIPDSVPDARHETESSADNPLHAPTLSIESQLKLRALYEYTENSRTILKEIQEDLSSLKSDPDGSLHRQKASERLARFCTEADSWGFNDLYEVGMGLQMLLLNSGGRIESGSGMEALDRGQAILLALLQRCENDFRCRLALADTFDCFDRVV